MAKAFQDELILAAGIPDDPIRCPRCQGGNINLKGFLRRDFEDVWEEGQSVACTLGDEALLQEVEVVECRDCHIRFVIISRRLYELEQEHSRYLAALAIANGQGNAC
jgi:DNA-directed RNA polymerase subunit RPC12/RpoP